MKSIYTDLRLAKFIFIGSLLATLFALILFQENIVENISSLKSRYLQNGQVVTVPYISVATLNSSTTLTHQPFAKLMRSFPWLPYKKATIKKDIPVINMYSELLLTSVLIPFITKEPPTPIKTSCKAPPLPTKPDKCIPLKNGTAPKRIGVILNFGFDVDALEVHLHELYSLVDRFFLVEGTKINNRFLGRKPSIWDLVKHTSRFLQFQSKIVHFIVDDADYHEEYWTPEMWSREILQGKLRLEKFLQWNQATDHFSSDDWIGIGDTDEIPSRQAINFLKNCEINGYENGGVDIGIWFPFPYDDTILKTDFPVSSHPYTLGNPTYWKVTEVGKLYREGKSTGRTNGHGSDNLLGGMHFSFFPYLPFQLTKLLTGTESEIDAITWAIEIGMMYLNGTESDNNYVETAALNKLEEPRIGNMMYKIKTLKKFRETFGDHETNRIVKIPWFYECNPDRFPGFRRKLDKRLF